MNIPDYCELPSCTISALMISAEDLVLSRVHCLDRCIVPELQTLWGMGISTYCSCCGHGDEARAFIRVSAECAERMEALGYERYEPHECSFYKNSMAFRAKSVMQEREKGKPDEPCDI